MMRDNSIVYDLDCIASAFRLGRGHNAESRDMANALLGGFCSNATEFTDDVIVVRCAPTISEIDEISPDKAVICWTEQNRRNLPRGRVEALQQRVLDAMEWLRCNDIPIQIIET